MSDAEFEKRLEDEVGPGPLEVLQRMLAMRDAVLRARNVWLLVHRGRAARAATHLTKAANAMLRDIEQFNEELKKHGV